MGSNTHAHHQQHHLQLCTEGLGFESFDDVEEMKSERDDQSSSSSSTPTSSSGVHHRNYSYRQLERSRTSGGGGGGGGSASVIKSFPPPISCIGRSGKPWICFKSYRQDGRFVLKEVRIPTKEFLHACREDGRLRLHLVQPDGDEQQPPPRDQQTHDDDQDKDEEDEKIYQSSQDETFS